MKIISWQPVLTDHQSHTLEALKKSGNCDLTVYVLSLTHTDRQAQGWVNNHADLLSPECLPRTGGFRFAIRQLRENRGAVHLFGSPFERIRLMVVLLTAVTMGCRVYLISEPYSPISVGYLNDRRHLVTRAKALLRPLAYLLYGWLISRRIAGVFAISCLAVKQYQGMGVPKKNVFPFGYFVPPDHKPPLVITPSRDEEKALTVIFVGSLIARKGLDILISAIRELENQGFSIALDVYGPGDPGAYGFNQTTTRYRGSIPFGNAQAIISQYDLLVLPSRYDGWGVVVNEALLAGVPVICSNQVGAGALVRKWSCGTTFLSENVMDLTDKLKSLLTSPKLLSRWRRAVTQIAEVLPPEVAGQYMFDVIRRGPAGTRELPAPACPWYDCP
jgi:glycosyltransferase involved in cell wall biosynthesis